MSVETLVIAVNQFSHRMMPPLMTAIIALSVSRHHFFEILDQPAHASSAKTSGSRMVPGLHCMVDGQIASYRTAK